VPRRPRDTAPGVHHVVVKATGPSAYFRDDVDRMVWIRQFVRTLRRYDWTCLIFCQMTTHVHGLVDVADDSLSQGMQSLNSSYGVEFNTRHGREGHVVGGRFWSERKPAGREILTAYRYVARNPLEGGLCPRPEEWPWSSYATTIGLEDRFPFVDPTLVLSQLGSSPAAAIVALRAFVEHV
jgi:putative transposase